MRTELSWTHYRTLLRVENPAAREQALLRLTRQQEQKT